MNSNSTSNPNHIDHIKSHFCTIGCVSWSAIIIGAIIAISFSFLLNMLSLAIGLTAFPTSSSGQTTFAVWSFVGLVIFAILAMFPAGYVAGLLGRSRCLKRKMGELYGLSAWGLALIVTMFLASSISQFVSQSSYLVNRQSINIKVTDVNTGEMYKVNKAPNGTPTVNVDAEKATETAGIATFATFFIFFIGLLSACFGGRCGMICKRKAILNNAHCCQCHGEMKK